MSDRPPSSSASSPLISSLHSTLLQLHSTPYPTLTNPPNCTRRASVALIVRIRPNPGVPLTESTSSPLSPSSLASDNSFTNQLESFFLQPWVQSGTPEILFIKRAARRGDRWTSHIAFPGGKRDPEDLSDEFTAEREVREEVGLDIAQSLSPSSSSSTSATTAVSTSSTALLAGPLPQRIVTTDFGFIPLMVLCPFVYILTSPNAPVLTLQPTEVASAHWIPIPALLDPSARTYEAADIVDRFASRWGYTTRTILGWMLGQALYGAIRLRPSESTFAPDYPVELAPTPARSTLQRLRTSVTETLSEDFTSSLRRWGLIGADPDPGRRLLLWGLTQGIAADFLGLLPVAKGLEWWRWPTLSRSDVRFGIWVVSWWFRREREWAVKTGRVPVRSNGEGEVEGGEQGMRVIGEGLGVRNGGEGKGLTPRPASIYSGVGYLLDGYFEQMQRAVWIVLAIRTVVTATGAWWVYRRYWRRSRL